MTYHVVYARRGMEELRGLERPARALVYGWIAKNLEGCADPRRFGEGDAEGGRWRYRVGEYRLIAEIEEERIVILAVSTGLGLRRGGGRGEAGPNVFLRSTLRQPVKTALLLLVTALITAAFVARASEYLLIRQEADRLGSYYRAAGTLASTTGDRWADTGEAVAYLESNPRIQLVNTFHYTSAVMEEDFCNADVNGVSPSKAASQFYFYGTLYDWDYSAFYFTVDTVLAGHPEIVEAGDRVTLFKSSRQKNREREFEALCAQLERGGRYLAVGYYMPDVDSQCRVETEETPGGAQRTTYACLAQLNEQTRFYPVAQGGEADWDSPLLRPLPEEGGYPVKDYIQYARDVQRTLNIIPIRDMSALPAVQDTAAGIYLTDGRWLDSEDDRQGRKVCVINAALASMRGLAVGDTLTLRLQDIPSHFGYLQNLADISDDIRTVRSAQTDTDTYEIVGIYEYLRRYPGSEVRNFTYLPASAVPETFQMTTRDNVWPELFEMYFFEHTFTQDTTSFFPGEVSFVLRSPEDEAQFMAETRAGLAAMGFEAAMTENGWGNFQATVEPMRRSSLASAAIFATLLAAAVCLLAVIYYRMRRRDIAIARAMGLPAGRCAWAACLPLVLIGALGMAVGGALGWSYTASNAAGILAKLGEDAVGGLPGGWLAALLAAALILLLLAAGAGAAYLATRSVLSLIQGGAAAVREARTAAGESGPIPSIPLGNRESSAAVRAQPEAVPAPAAGGGAAHILRFSWRHVCRARLKSALALALAAGFTVGLAAIRLSIMGSEERIDWLYANTSAEAELLRADSVQTVQSSGFIRQDTVEALLDSGYVTDVYLEGAASGAVTRYNHTTIMGNAISVDKSNKLDVAVRALGSEEIFLTPAGSGGAVTIEYLDGWDGGLFSQDWPEDRPFPVVLPRETAAYSNTDHIIGLACKGFRMCQVAGFYDGEVAGGSDTAPVLIPLSVYRQIGGTRAVAYSKVHVTLAPSLNRELETFTQVLSEISARQSGMVALRAVIWDEELRLAVAPLENSMELMRVLYPVTLILSLLTAAGIAALFVMTSAKEAAILRVLGTTKRRSRVMLSLQTGMTSLAGLLFGFTGVLAYTARTRPELLAGLMGTSVLCAALYLLAAILGAAVSAVSVTGKNPLELLQVRE